MTEEDTGGGGQKYNPHVVRGFKGLAHRVKSQELTIQAQEAQLKALSEKVEMIRSEQHTLDMEIKEITDENARLTQDILHNLRAPSQVNHHKVGSCWYTIGCQIAQRLALEFAWACMAAEHPGAVEWLGQRRRMGGGDNDSPGPGHFLIHSPLAAVCAGPRAAATAGSHGAGSQ